NRRKPFQYARGRAMTQHLGVSRRSTPNMLSMIYERNTNRRLRPQGFAGFPFCSLGRRQGRGASLPSEEVASGSEQTNGPSEGLILSRKLFFPALPRNPQPAGHRAPQRLPTCLAHLPIDTECHARVFCRQIFLPLIFLALGALSPTPAHCFGESRRMRTIRLAMRSCDFYRVGRLQISRRRWQWYGD